VNAWAAYADSFASMTQKGDIDSEYILKMIKR
jgi:hypothetical protein